MTLINSTGFRSESAYWLVLSMLVFLAAACQPGTTQVDLPTPSETQTPTKPSPLPTQSQAPQPADTGIAPEVFSYGLTYIEPDGNRLIEGTSAYSPLEPIDIPLPGKPIWLTATAYDAGIFWTATLEDGRTYTYQMLEDGKINADPLEFNLKPGRPPSAVSHGNSFSLVLVQAADQSQVSHPVHLPLSDARAHISQSGELKIVGRGENIIATFEIDALPDARIIRDENDRMLVLSGQTNIYAHGVLGDQIEASGVTLLETHPEPRAAAHFAVNENEVIEGISPIWVDMTGDGKKEIVITVSKLDEGARIVILDDTGSRIAQGPSMGTPYRWRHQIAVSNFGPGGEVELAVVRTPHIDGIAEFYRLENGELTIAAEFPGITSHKLGSRNLDMAAAGDFDGDEKSELLVLSPDLMEIIAVHRTDAGAEQAFRLSIGGEITTNLGGATLPDGRPVLAVGNNENLLRIWLPSQ